MPAGTSVWRRPNKEPGYLLRGARSNVRRGTRFYARCATALVLTALTALPVPGTAVRAGEASAPPSSPIHDDASVPVRGVVRALDQSALSTDLVARVLKIGFREGEAFKTGELLVAFDCERYKAEAQSAEAVHREMRLTLDSNMHLQKFSAVGKADVEISRARVDKAEAEARSLKTRLEQCEITAPFDGKVAELSINAYEQPQPGKPFLVIVGNSRLEIELIVPSHWLNTVKAGAEFSFKVDETRHAYKARVLRTGAAVDAVSQMIKVIAVFDEPVSDVLPGMSGAAQFPHPNG